MAGVNYTIDTTDYERVVGIIEQWARGVSLASLNKSMGAEVESQTRRRIEDERTAPDGTPWADWSPAYAATRHSNHSLLQNEGDLVDSLAAIANAQQVEVGTNLVYAAPHQFGSAKQGIPARPFLGMSDENQEDVLNVVEDWVAQQLKRLRT